MCKKLVDLLAAHGKNAIWPGLASFVYQEGWDYEEIADYVNNRGVEIGDEFVETFWASLPAFTEQGFRYVIFQYLSFSLRHPESDSAERTILRLHNMCKTNCPWLGGWSAAELDAIIGALLELYALMKCACSEDPLCNKISSTVEHLRNLAQK